MSGVPYASLRKLSAEEIAEAEALRSDNPKHWTYKRLARRYGCSDTCMCNNLNPLAREKKRARQLERDRRAREDSDIIKRPRVTSRDLALARRRIPPDTRDFTARFFGDPIPGMSALDRRGAQ